jgi:4-amino-4-deoxy-L-arabinose transferase-like glycosyltransferase
MRLSLNDSKAIVVIIILSLMVYVPYILSFNNKESERNYWSGDSWWYMQIVESMVENGDLDMSNNIPASMHVSQNQLALSAKGYLVPKHGIFFPLVSTPFYLLFGDAGFPLFNLLLTIGILIVMYQIIRLFFDELISL